jgi:hypothetical protein
MKRKRKHLQTDFIKFILEKYSNEGQDLPEDEIPIPDDESEEPELRKNRKIKLLNEIDDEVDSDEEEPQPEEDEMIDELLNEYKKIKKKYESTKFRKRRK